ncbi:C-type lectin domain family 2 member D2-like [Peromyscus eremicus]|uniref:C-type lectin domain family 2 member D2-like n=1 Tax=Peromyscus eremicus TaxID=42410 RepID=UPI0027DDB9FD|nr:C-type lectin domain family 2 member D2-like [Peromyscus eremicus]
MGEPEVSVSTAAPDFELCLGPPGASKSHTPLGKKLQGKFHGIIDSVFPVKRPRWSAVIIIIVVVAVAVIAFLFALSLSVIKKKTSTTNPGAGHANCPRDWFGFGSKCFYFSEVTNNWTSSQTSCMKLKAHLARFDSLEELDFLKRHKNDSARWIGLHRKSSKHSWRWTDNTKYNNLYDFGPLFLCCDTELLMATKGSGTPGSHCRTAGVRLVRQQFTQQHLSQKQRLQGLWEPPLKSHIKEHPRQLLDVSIAILNRPISLERVDIRGEGECVYLIDEKVSSGRERTTRKWICSMPKNYTL